MYAIVPRLGVDAKKGGIIMYVLFTTHSLVLVSVVPTVLGAVQNTNVCLKFDTVKQVGRAYAYMIIQ